ncbi:MAG TPA: aspartate/glutamate racemase family protein [Solirubrobacterales bacterium]|nr:aspartate/glutamate racemase family protein [Solirubrobacterales bacterium]
MRVCLLNPNSTEAMTDEMVAAARAVASTGTEIEGITASEAPATIEGYRDEALAAAAVAAIVEESSDRFDAFVIACFGDPGLHAAREIFAGPVVGIAEASFMLAVALGHRFAILTNTESDIPEMEELVRRHGFGERCSGVEAVALGVADADADRDAAFPAYEAAGRTAIAAGAEVLCLGCGPMLGLRERLEASLGAPVLEPVPAGIAIAESLLRLGLATSKLGAFRPREA